MDRYEQLLRHSPEKFRRLTGVQPATFSLMLATYQRQYHSSKKVSGRPSRLSDAVHILMMLEYNREYRTYCHIAESYGVSESTAYKIIKRVEDVLIASGEFSLPKKSALYQPATPIKMVIVDVTESPVQRPKKTEIMVFRQAQASPHKDTSPF